MPHDLDPTAVADLGDITRLLKSADTAHERDVYRTAFDGLVEPELVDGLIGFYENESPTVEELDTCAQILRGVANRLVNYGTVVPPAAGYAVITMSPHGWGTIQRSDNMAFILQATQEVDLSVTYADRAGNTADVETETWSSSDTAILAITDNGDGTAVASAVGPLGTAQIQLTADARFGPDVVEIIGVLDVEIVASEAVSATIVPGEPRDTAPPV